MRGEAAGGNTNAAQRRLVYLTPLPELDVPDELDQLEADLIGLFQLPPRAATDASHLGMAVLHSRDRTAGRIRGAICWKYHLGSWMGA